MSRPSQPWLYRMLEPDGRQSLRRRLLAFLLVPLMAMLFIESLITYTGALVYSNSVHDRDLAGSAETVAQMMQKEGLDGPISEQARFLLQYDPEGHNNINYFSIVSQRHGLLAGSDKLTPPSGLGLSVNGEPKLFDIMLDRRRLRAAGMIIDSVHEEGDQLTITVAETLRDRRQRAKEILLLSIPAQALLIAAVFVLVWFGVRIGLRQLDPLTARLARREHDLAPIGDADVPVEILPLTRTIDGLFARLRGMLALQERFIADAAHQLRTPLAGLRVHVERAQSDPTPETVKDALQHILRLTQRATRTSGQLLALTRAQSPDHDDGAHALIDLARLVPDLLTLRVHEALAAGVDLGYEGPPQPVWIDGDRTTLQELLDNLIDNSLRYAGRRSEVTVSVSSDAKGAMLNVEDNGPGVPAAFLARLGERFFRVPGSNEEGTGLGLAIVQRIAERHHARVRYVAGSEGGLRVEILFPPARTTKKDGDA
ncbi:two-component system, OmpR family, sensor histidine kinase TctE [Dyella sp. OK004]|uniref:sensor histidine kinase n=1 Tax=Dyella sp. OK004 TaxID=1855292 RepID=UPI0008EC038C|nr:sensor histidine kinase [Dyella sp. OK004]SFS05046.1 two-component system, OmpR family, sensor histidine kinase TctE [Dyella sp. OK004]